MLSLFFNLLITLLKREKSRHAIKTIQNIKYIEHFVKKHDTIVLSKVKRLDK